MTRHHLWLPENSKLRLRDTRAGDLSWVRIKDNLFLFFTGKILTCYGEFIWEGQYTHLLQAANSILFFPRKSRETDPPSLTSLWSPSFAEDNTNSVLISMLQGAGSVTNCKWMMAHLTQGVSMGCQDTWISEMNHVLCHVNDQMWQIVKNLFPVAKSLPHTIV